MLRRPPVSGPPHAALPPQPRPDRTGVQNTNESKSPSRPCSSGTGASPFGSSCRPGCRPPKPAARTKSPCAPCTMYTNSSVRGVGRGGADVSGPTRLRASAGVEGRGRVRGSQGTHREDQHDGKPEADLHDGNGRGRRRCTSGAASAHRGASAAAADPVAHTGKRARARRDAHSTVPVRQRAQQQQGARSGAGHCGGTRGSMATLGEGEAQDRRSTAAGSAPPPAHRRRARKKKAPRAHLRLPRHTAPVPSTPPARRAAHRACPICVLLFLFSPFFLENMFCSGHPFLLRVISESRIEQSIRCLYCFAPHWGRADGKEDLQTANNDACPCDE